MLKLNLLALGCAPAFTILKGAGKTEELAWLVPHNERALKHAEGRFFVFLIRNIL